MLHIDHTQWRLEMQKWCLHHLRHGRWVPQGRVNQPPVRTKLRCNSRILAAHSFRDRSTVPFQAKDCGNLSVSCCAVDWQCLLRAPIRWRLIGAQCEVARVASGLPTPPPPPPPAPERGTGQRCPGADSMSQTPDQHYPSITLKSLARRECIDRWIVAVKRRQKDACDCDVTQTAVRHGGAAFPERYAASWQKGRSPGFLGGWLSEWWIYRLYQGSPPGLLYMIQSRAARSLAGPRTNRGRRVIVLIPDKPGAN